MMQINKYLIILIFTIFYISELRDNLINKFLYNTTTSFIDTYITNIFSADDIIQHMGVEDSILELIEVLEDYSLIKVQSEQLALKKLKLSKSQMRKLCTYFEDEMKRLEALALDNLRKCIKYERSFSTFLIAYCEHSIIVGDHYHLMEELFKSRSKCISILKENLDDSIDKKIDRKLMKLHYKFQSNQSYLYSCLKLIIESIEVNRNFEEMNRNLKKQIEDGNTWIKNNEEVAKSSLKLESNILEIGLKKSYRKLYDDISSKLGMNKGKETQDKNQDKNQDQDQDKNQDQDQDKNQDQDQDKNQDQDQIYEGERSKKILEATVLTRLEKEISEMEKHREEVFKNEEQRNKELERLERVRLRNEILERDRLAIEKLEKKKKAKREKQRLENMKEQELENMKEQELENMKEQYLDTIKAERTKEEQLMEYLMKKEDITRGHLYNKICDLHRKKVKLGPSNSWIKRLEEEEIKKEEYNRKRREEKQMQIKSDLGSILNRLKGTKSEFSLLWEKTTAEKKKRRDNKEKEIEKEKLLKSEMERLKQLELMELEVTYKAEACKEYQEQLQREISEEDMRQQKYCNIVMENIQSERERNREYEERKKEEMERRRKEYEEKKKEEMERRKRSLGEEWLKIIARKEANQEEKRKSLQQKHGEKGGINGRWEEIICSERLKKERKETERRESERRNLEKVMKDRRERLLKK
ncbi:uncharacterized protein CMU_032540 [Cryptosporidium muris RN66]|uniref:Uncharacterized protein n=1 Tax=Cryptosporidium muris (strain RN66) TaxID=441375 RepID=B6AF78_CRYMR|nr:uncharacterized protein CMU_032540 [Cryptosporidium muris RN66]EEA06869.1 hypothetical protein CMU_032540 [Cryptosporidium muris RN66]|eukprot:XP_002141218.1 hypothetical protein [Cryptosporidium muris RN66]